MPLVEQALGLLKNPPFIDTSDSSTSLEQAFLAGKLSLEEFLSARHSLSETNGIITLPSPGPLYGLLRRLGLDITTCKIITYEERDHLAVAREQGVTNTQIKIVISRGEEPVSQDPTFPRAVSIQVSLNYSLPKGISDARAREIMTKILLAPSSPSKSDLAKIPPRPSW